jgi:inosose dehydratase
MVQRLGDWADAAKAGGVRFVVKAHVTMAVNTPERLLWLLHEVNRPEIRVAFDYSHFEVQGIPLEDSWAQLRPYVDFVHVKDTAGDAKKPIFLLPGEGRTDYEAYFKMLERTGYTGPVVVEVSTQIFSRPGYDPVKAAESSYAALAQALRQSKA